MSEKDFFKKQTASSRIKANIVSDYFPSYCKIITKKNIPREIRFVDLFAGPGIYQDGSHSTPMLIARHCYNDPFLKQHVMLMFNDKEHINELKANFFKEFAEDSFPKQPRFGDKVVGQDEPIRKFLMRDTHEKKKNVCPTLLFIDPFGYKGIETSVLAKFMENWGNELFLFVNIKRIHPALENEKFEDLMKLLFPSTLEKVRNDRRYKMTTADRINLIIQCLGEEYETLLKSKVYYTAFKFQEEDNEATSHYILHFTKHPRGFDLVKQIYNDFANVGTIFDGKSTYTFDAKHLDEGFQLFDTKAMNIDLLKDALYDAYKGQQVTALKLFDDHQRGNLYSRSHYASALRNLESEGKLRATFIDNKIHKVSVLLTNDCILNFL